jgi:hypothetical protein
MRRIRWAVVAALALSLLVASAAAADPILTDPQPQQKVYPLIIESELGPGQTSQAFIGCEVNPTTGERDTLLRYRITTTGDVQVVTETVGSGFVFIRATAGTEGGTILHLVLCERTATG